MLRRGKPEEYFRLREMMEKVEYSDTPFSAIQHVFSDEWPDVVKKVERMVVK
jgi:hypothetical protein